MADAAYQPDIILVYVGSILSGSVPVPVRVFSPRVELSACRL